MPIFLEGERSFVMVCTFSRLNMGTVYAAPPGSSLLPGHITAGRVRGLPLPPLMVPAKIRRSLANH
jgi:hypothetical protein